MKFASAKAGLAVLSVPALLIMGLSACQQASAPAPEGAASEASGPEAKPGMTLTGGELVLPVVTGRPGVVYFSLANGGDKTVTLVSAYVEGAASAEIHETSGGTMQARDSIEIAPGETVTFAPGGLHVMAFDLPEDLTAGGTSELTLTFADGDKISAPLAVKAMHDDGAMAGMAH